MRKQPAGPDNTELDWNETPEASVLAWYTPRVQRITVTDRAGAASVCFCPAASERMQRSPADVNAFWGGRGLLG